MIEMTEIFPIGLYFIVGDVCLLMAYKNLFSIQFIPFHEKAAGIAWDKVDIPLQYTILALMRVSGLGFLVIGLLLTIFPIVNYFNADPFVKYAIPVISFLYCTGLFLVNYYLHIQTKAATPWKGSFYVMFIIIAGIVISSL